MSCKLFSYGTLQLEAVQLESFGRKLLGQADHLPGYEIRDCLIQDPAVIETSGKNIHPIACYTANLQDEIAGTLFEVTPEEMEEADRYEVDDYKKIACTLKSGEVAWVYVQRFLNIDDSALQQGDIRLELLKEQHIPELCNKAQDKRIWTEHSTNLHTAEHFKDVRLKKAKEAMTLHQRYVFVIYYRDEIIGETSFYDISLKHLSLKIGYSWLHPDYWGKGINARVKNLLLDYAFKQLKFKRVAFCVDTTNRRSRAALEKLGIPLEGILKNHLIRADGTQRDSALYALTDKLWAQKNKHTSLDASAKASV